MLQQNYSSAMASLEEPLLNSQQSDQNSTYGGVAEHVEFRESPVVNPVIWFFNFVFYIICFLSGQYYVKTDTSIEDSVRSTWKTKARVVLSCLGLVS